MSELPEQQTFSWERLPDETDKAYNAFLLYLGLPPFRRSLLEATRCLYPSQEKAQRGPKKPNIPGSMKRWFEENRWLERAREFDRASVQRDLELTQELREATLVKAWKDLYTLVQQQGERIVVDDAAEALSPLKFDPDQATRWGNTLQNLIKYIEQGESPDALAELERLLQKEGLLSSEPDHQSQEGTGTSSPPPKAKLTA